MKREIINPNNQYSHKIKITPAKGRKNKEPFNILVVDVRDNRNRADEMIKDDNIRKGSKFFKTSFSVIGKPYN